MTKREHANVVWSGSWVADRLGVGLTGDDRLPDLLGLALRRNPKRAHLLVSNVLGKHVPQSPAVVYGAGFALGERVRKLLGDEAAARSVVLGYAETATGLGHSVADGVALAPYLHSTRRPVEGVRTAGGFEESHSHATSHLLLPEDAGLLSGRGPLVLVDDEFSTGNTVLNTIRDLHGRYPRERYVIVALVDMRAPADRTRLETFAREIDARVDLVALASGTVRLPEGVLAKGQALVAEHEPPAGAMPDAPLVEAAGRASAVRGAAVAAGRASAVRVELAWPTGVPDGGRHGFLPGHRERLEAALPGMAARIAGALGSPPVSTGLGGSPVGVPAEGTTEVAASAAPGAAPAGAADAADAAVAVDAPSEGAAHGAARVGPAGVAEAADARGGGPAEAAVVTASGVGPAAAAAPAEGAADGPARTAPGARPIGSAEAAIRSASGVGLASTAAHAMGATEAAVGTASGAGSASAAAPAGPGGRPVGAAGAPGAAGGSPAEAAIRTASNAVPAGTAAPDKDAAEATARTAPRASRRPRILILGFEELMYAPLRLGTALEQVLDADVRYSTTTRSPVLAVDHPGYAIRSRLLFPAHDHPADGPGERYAYNVAGADFDAVVAVVDSAADTPQLHAPDGLLAQLAAHTPHVVLAVVPSYVPGSYVPGPPERASMLPDPLRGPAFSSYSPDDVGWLLQDLSEAELEAPTEEREEAIQSGGAHYAESLPVEYQPSAQYQELFKAALDVSATRIARAVGTVTETVLAERSPRPVLVSLARAGTPVGVLMRRWAQYRHGLDLPHYAVSIVRGRGIDANALRWLQQHHDPADVVFVDGWTGKGAITRELAAALAEFDSFNRSNNSNRFNPEIAVLADPGGCVSTYGTREDFLIPSACLNSTVSGLISRTVLRADLVGPHDFHGAKFYRELADGDVSQHFLDTVAARFADVVDDVGADVKELLAADRAPTWEGWAAVERISEEYGIHDVNLVKPGVGEATRVLLRRVPWKILAKRGAGADLDHVRLLAEQRGVPVEEVDQLPYSCVGLIHPQYTRGATGADGKAVSSL
ncbi:phosphoribosyltransferase domain-containing protein [Streptomyces sp. NPDC052236]|uniref:phosphoribosyltransferase domain-containing protein n=1 Tax=Streptomyces sp. NPDC052236 TaxID=3365686 RepID=UPI0037CDB839